MDSSSKWIKIAGGELAIGHRPRKKDILSGHLGATHILTLLSEREGALEIAASAEAAGLTWLWLPLTNGDPANANEAETRAILKKVRQSLMSGAKVFIHCSAGIHRTGMIMTALLRTLGLTSGDASELLHDLRESTAAGIGHHRSEWANRFA